MGLPRVGSLVVVTWRDAYFDFDFDSRRDDYLVRTVGFVVDSDSDTFLSVAAEELPHDDGWRAVTNIPISLVVGWKEVS